MLHPYPTLKRKLQAIVMKKTKLGSKNDKEMIKLAKTQLSKFQQALKVKVLFFLDFFQ